MKIPTHILTGVALFAAALSTSYGQSATTTPVGYRTETLLPGFNLIGANLAEKVEAAGTITGVAGNVITDTNVVFTPLAGINLLLKLTSGANVGTLLQVDQSGPNSVTAVVGGNLAAVGDKYEVRASSDVAKLFGATNSAGLTAGSDLSVADNIYVPGPSGFTIVYYSNGQGLDGVGWKDSLGVDASNLEIPYSLGFFVRNSTATNKNVVFVGHVITSITKFPAVLNFNYVSRILPVPMTLDASLIKDQLTAGTDLSTGDNVYIPAGAAGYKICYYSNGGGLDPVGWTDGQSAPSGTTNLTSAMLILRRSATPVNVNLIIPTGLDL